MTVTVVGSEPSGLTTLVAELIEQNLARDRRRSRLLRPCVVVLDAPDAGVTTHVRIAPDRVRADAERLLAITNAPLRFGLPDPMSAEGRAVLLDLVARRVLVGGLLRHPLRLARSMSLLSVADGGDR